jgi:hypothetical protein
MPITAIGIAQKPVLEELVVLEKVDIFLECDADHLGELEDRSAAAFGTSDLHDVWHRVPVVGTGHSASSNYYWCHQVRRPRRAIVVLISA